MSFHFHRIHTVSGAGVKLRKDFICFDADAMGRPKEHSNRTCGNQASAEPAIVTSESLVRWWSAEEYKCRR